MIALWCYDLLYSRKGLLMVKWEYLVVFISDSKVAQDQPEIDVHMDADRYTESLSIYGQAGWELVSFEWEVDGAKAAFKRPISAPSDD